MTAQPWQQDAVGVVGVEDGQLVFDGGMAEDWVLLLGFPCRGCCTHVGDVREPSTVSPCPILLQRLGWA